MDTLPPAVARGIPSRVAAFAAVASTVVQLVYSSSQGMVPEGVDTASLGLGLGGNNDRSWRARVRRMGTG